MKKIAAALAALFITALPVVTSSPASAAGDGCGWDRYGMQDYWAEDRTFTRDNGSTGIVRISAVTQYNQCRNPNVAERKDKHTLVTYCWYFPQGYAPVDWNGATFQGGYYNKWGSDQFGDRYIETEERGVPRNGSDAQECTSVDLRSAGGHKTGNAIDGWWDESTTPVWTVDFVLRWEGKPKNWTYLSVPDWGPDPAGYSFAYATRLKRIIPGNDTQVSGPF